eukprot:TRINITY_DN1451_c0_g1_i1.p1 TRINITY_DN1451_c0_g1~~TRINITY_DN1451_c0_g1_i1.p1  ORF type:complete len:603 (-),score=78.92 TRINITY_DN1451_c0_g1_i1:111-1919(-)
MVELANRNIFIRPADKNLGPCLITFRDYNDMVRRLIENPQYYRHISNQDFNYETLCERLHEELVDLIQRLPRTADRNSIQDYAVNFVNNKQISLPIFYANPKIHKSPLEGRPIVGAHSWYTTPISTIVSTLLRGVIKQQRDTDFKARLCQNSLQVSNYLDRIKRIDDIRHLRAADFTSLYTHLRADEVTRAVSFFVRLHPTLHVYEDWISRALAYVLNNNYFEVPNNGFYQQTRGVAMGTNCAPDIANLTVLYYLHVSTPVWIDRCGVVFVYIDDLFVHTEQFDDVRWDQVFPSHLQLNWNQVTDKQVVYLDLAITRHPLTAAILYSTYQKEQNAYCYPHANSNIPLSIKVGFIKGECIRYLRTSNQLESYQLQKARFKLRLVARGYDVRFVNWVFKQVCYCDRPLYLRLQQNNNTEQPIVWKKTFNNCDHNRLNLMSAISSNVGLLPDGWRPLIRLSHKIARDYSSIILRSNINKFGRFGTNRNNNEPPPDDPPDDPLPRRTVVLCRPHHVIPFERQPTALPNRGVNPTEEPVAQTTQTLQSTTPTLRSPSPPARRRNYYYVLDDWIRERSMEQLRFRSPTGTPPPTRRIVPIIDLLMRTN